MIEKTKPDGFQSYLSWTITVKSVYKVQISAEDHGPFSDQAL